jgi:hypothetical protein
MTHTTHNWHTQLQALWEHALKLYRDGQRGSASYFNPEAVNWLASNGLTPQEIYDFVEDYACGGEPDFTTFALVTDVRRSYFLEELGGQSATSTIDPASYPPKTAEVEGIVWLPRILEKAKAKLRGQLDPDTMYGCGGDRKFFRNNGLHASEFLRYVAAHMDQDAAVIRWVRSRSANA